MQLRRYSNRLVLHAGDRSEPGNAGYGIPAFFNPLLNRQTHIYVNQARIYTQGVELDGELAFSRNLRVGAAGSSGSRER